ncbi:MAG: DNA repair protein RadC [Negativicutes bacterium]|nr:DNA repair protein RadC [Negativicutes bacterium]
MTTVAERGKAGRPDWTRERIWRGELDSLSDSELLAVLLRTGLPREPVLAMARRILDQCGGLAGLVSLPLAELRAVKGLGMAKVVTIAAATELVRRTLAGRTLRPKITSPDDAFAVLHPYLALEQREVVYAALLSAKNQLLTVRRIAEGAVSQAVFHPREVFRAAISFGASAVIVAHNHPSGEVSPSEDDRRLTGRLKSAGEVIGIRLLDHLIIGGDKYYSFGREGNL